MKIPLKHQIGAGLVLLLMAVGIFGHKAQADQTAIMLNLTQPIEAQKTNTATAKFAELTAEAMKYGMSDATVNGNIQYSMQPDRTIRSTIKWDSISIENGGKKVTEGLDEALTSKFRVPQDKPRAEPGTKLKAMGDIEALAKSLGKLKAQLDAQQTVVQKENTNSKTQSQAVAPVVSSQPATDSGKYLSDAGSPFSTTITPSTTTTYSLCDARFIDLASMKAVKQYKPVYTQSGVQTGEGVCAANFSEFAPILSKDGDCTYRFDFANSTAIKQEQLYYSDGTQDVNVNSCRDSSTLYPLTESRLGCSVTTDLANMKVFPQSKMIFTVGTLEQNATMCRPVSSSGIALQEEACDPMWENDFVNHVSYLVTRMYYLSDVDGSKIYVNQCGRSSTVSFPHFTDTTGCGWVMDDVAMIGSQQGKTIIRTGAIAGDVVIQGSHTVATLNYTFIGTVTKNQKITANGTFTIPPGTVSSAALIVGRGQYGSNRRNNTGGEYATCINGFPGKAGQYVIQDFGNATGVVNVLFNQGTGSCPGDTKLTFGGTSYTAISWNDCTSIQWNARVGDGDDCPAPYFGVQGYTTPGRFGINSAADYPQAGGCGWGAGGIGGMSTEANDTAMCSASPGSSVSNLPMPYNPGYIITAPVQGVVIIEYKANSYMRPDATVFTPGS